MRPLRYHAPLSTAEACALLHEHDSAALLGGGTVLLPAMKRGRRNHAHVIDLRRVGLAGISVAPETQMAHVGAMTTYADLSRSGALAGSAFALVLASRGITGGAQLRNQATIGGSASYANPASDMPGCLVGISARIVIQGAGGEREMPAADFFLDAFQTALQPGELLTGFRVPTRLGRVGYYKLKLSESSWPIATATAVVPYRSEAPSGSSPQPTTVTLGGVAARPITLNVGDMVSDEGQIARPDLFDRFVSAALDDPWEDELAPASYRRQVAGPVARRAIRHAVGEQLS